MASYPKFGCFLFLLIISLSSIQTHARGSQFFSKFTRNGDTATTTTTPNTDYNPNNNEKEFVHLKKQQSEEQPVFIPQTTETGYGLYGHETGLDPPSTSTTLYNMDDINNNNNNNENFNTNNNNEYHEKNYATELQGLSSTSYTNNNNNNYENNNNNNYENYNNNNYENYNNNNNNGEGKFHGGAGYNDVQEKQGMSDTRFMYNGKYFYDLEAEKKNNYNPNNNNYMSYSNNYNNNYNNNGYYGNKMNNFEEFYNNNNNQKFYNGNGYQNQFPEEEEFDFDQP
ncbi:protein E6 [Amaranthus tricolor]|uniref:protein E6 n=1 Tax=Amaranthus tricolor TaxID=29722 RepID=UPI00258CC2D8|nr:protein E6 [Amaranthus tricolor]